jgi:effector-binding domain-containing protein
MSAAPSIGAALVLLAATTAAAGAQSPPASAPSPVPEAKVITTEAIHALVLPMKGSYAQHPAAFERLGAFLAAQGVGPSGAPFARYFSDPSVGEDNLEWEVGFPVPAGVTAEAPFAIKDLPASLAAVRVHNGPYEELATAWPDFIQWIASNGYQPAGAPLQIFQDSSAPTVEMRIPVEKVR